MTRLSKDALAAVSVAVKITHRSGGVTGATYELRCTDAVGNEIRKLFETLDEEFKQQPDGYHKARTCYLAGVDIGNVIAKGAQVRRLS